MKTAEANMHLAQTTSVRWQGLLGKNAVSKQETDQMTSDYAARQATYAASQANVRRLKELQGYERVIAPFDGTITARNTDIGALISGSGTSTGGSAMSPHELFHLDSERSAHQGVGWRLGRSAVAESVRTEGRKHMTESCTV
jgi:multidrug efflux pump subunit AcrA (membrane-fusion protein)